jgi:hypothetical protein
MRKQNLFVSTIVMVLTNPALLPLRAIFRVDHSSRSNVILVKCYEAKSFRRLSFVQITFWPRCRVSCETSFDSKQPKLESKLVSILSETSCCFGCFGSISKQRVSVFRCFGSTETKQKTTETNRKKRKKYTYTLGGADFWIFWIFNWWQPAADVKCYSKTKVAKAFFFISCIPLRK